MRRVLLFFINYKPYSVLEWTCVRALPVQVTCTAKNPGTLPCQSLQKSEKHMRRSFSTRRDKEQDQIVPELHILFLLLCFLKGFVCSMCIYILLFYICRAVYSLQQNSLYSKFEETHVDSAKFCMHCKSYHCRAVTNVS